MRTFQLTSELVTAGTSNNQLAVLRRQGQLVHLRRGVYARSVERDFERRHRLLIESTLELSDSRSVVSFGSAALLHGLPVWRPAIQKVHLTRPGRGGGQIRSLVHIHTAELSASDITEIDGIPVTSLARTLVDHALTSPLTQAVAAGDPALLAGLDPSDLQDQLDLARNRRRIGRARYAMALLDPASESPGESMSRVGFIEERLPWPELQAEIWDGDVFIARVDFLWREYGLIGEFDGKSKYGRLLREGETPADAVYREKVREDKLRQLRFGMTRWDWRAASDRTPMITQVEQALRLGRPYDGPATIRPWTRDRSRDRNSQPRYL